MPEQSIINDIANSNVIMTETLMYALASFFILVLLDVYAAKGIGDRRRPAYKALRIYKSIAFFIVAVVTAAVAILCLGLDWSVTRGTLTYFGLPYFIAVIFYMVKVFRRVSSEKRRRKL